MFAAMRRWMTETRVWLAAEPVRVAVVGVGLLVGAGAGLVGVVGVGGGGVGGIALRKLGPAGPLPWASRSFGSASADEDWFTRVSS